MTKLIILTAFFRITQDCIRLRSFFELLFSFSITRIHIRVILLGNLSVCFFQSCFVSIFTDPKHLIVISF